MKSKKLIIHIKEKDGHNLVAFNLEELSKDEAIIILNRCLFTLLNEYDKTFKLK